MSESTQNVLGLSAGNRGLLAMVLGYSEEHPSAITPTRRGSWKRANGVNEENDVVTIEQHYGP